jgi:hypothetical protein
MSGSFRELQKGRSKAQNQEVVPKKNKSDEYQKGSLKAEDLRKLVESEVEVALFNLFIFF